MKETIEKALEIAKTPGKLTCGECGDELFSPMDKLSLALYHKCSIHLEGDGPEQNNLLTISESL